MLLIEKKVIEEKIEIIRTEIEFFQKEIQDDYIKDLISNKRIAIANYLNLIENSKEVEVADIEAELTSAVYKKELTETTAQYLNKNGYKLIKIK